MISLNSRYGDSFRIQCVRVKLDWWKQLVLFCEVRAFVAIKDVSICKYIYESRGIEDGTELLL